MVGKPIISLPGEPPGTTPCLDPGNNGRRRPKAADTPLPPLPSVEEIRARHKRRRELAAAAGESTPPHPEPPASAVTTQSPTPPRHREPPHPKKPKCVVAEPRPTQQQLQMQELLRRLEREGANQAVRDQHRAMLDRLEARRKELTQPGGLASQFQHRPPAMNAIALFRGFIGADKATLKALMSEKQYSDALGAMNVIFNHAAQQVEFQRHFTAAVTTGPALQPVEVEWGCHQRVVVPAEPDVNLYILSWRTKPRAGQTKAWVCSCFATEEVRSRGIQGCTCTLLQQGVIQAVVARAMDYTVVCGKDAASSHQSTQRLGRSVGLQHVPRSSVSLQEASQLPSLVGPL